jgi:hypothetical protein
MATGPSNSIQELYNSVKWQNDMIQTQESVYKKEFSSDNQKVKYLVADISYFTYINFILWVIYYILCLGVIYVTIYGKDRGYSRWIKGLIIIAFLVYPFLIITIELGLYSLFSFLYSFMVGSAYKKGGSNEKPSFDLINALPPGTY